MRCAMPAEPEPSAAPRKRVKLSSIKDPSGGTATLVVSADNETLFSAEPPPADAPAVAAGMVRSADGDELPQAKSDRAVGAVMVYMALKVMADTTTTAVWPLLLLETYGGDVARATTAAATMSSLCGVAELLINPMVGRLSDALGRKPFFYLGPLANCLTSLLQIAYPHSVAACYLQRVASQTLSTVSGSTIGTATLADVASGDKLTGALGALGSWAGLGVIIGPLISGTLTRVFGSRLNPVTVAFGARAVVSGSTVLFLALRLQETLPVAKRRPFTLGGVNPLGFLRLFRGSAPLRRLALANGLASMCEGKMTSDTNIAYIRNEVGFGADQITAYLTSWGVACFCSGKYLVKAVVRAVGPRVYTDIAMTTNALAHLVLGLVPHGWAVWAYVALLTPGINNLSAAAIKSQAAAHAIAGGMGKGEFSAAMASLRAVTFVLAPTAWGAIYAACVRAGRPPGLSLVGAGLVGAVLPALLHRTLSAEDWAPPES